MLNNTDSDNDEFKQIAEANFIKISSNVTKIGYTEGITEGSEIAFQKGFDAGYKDGLRLGFEIAKYNSLVKGLKIENDPQLKNELDNFEENFESINPLNKENIKILSLNKSIDDITNLENEKFDIIVTNLKKNYPNINKFF